MSQRKLAVFVEGQTEQIFIERLITEIASAREVTFVRLQATGGRPPTPRQFIALSGHNQQHPATRYYVQIVDSHTDNRVVSDIRDTQASLARAGFDAVLGIRDVYPVPRASIPTMRAATAAALSGAALPVDLVLAVMEVEAWFLGEHNHFARIGAGIPIADIMSYLGFDPSTQNMEGRAHPAEDLHEAYKLVGCAYHKTAAHIQRTVGALDYAHLYLDLPARMPSLRELIDALDRFLV